MEDKKLDMAVAAFSAMPDGELEFENLKAKNIDTISAKEFGKKFLIENVVNRSERRVRNSMSMER